MTDPIFTDPFYNPEKVWFITRKDNPDEHLLWREEDGWYITLADSYCVCMPGDITAIRAGYIAQEPFCPVSSRDCGNCRRLMPTTVLDYLCRSCRAEV